MYRIAVLTDQTDAGQRYMDQISDFCEERGIFPNMELYQDRELFFLQVLEKMPTSVVVDLPGVTGLNAVEHLRSLCPHCGIIWCSDLDFSLHAFRLRVESFLLKPITEESLRQGVALWFDRREN